MQGAGSIRKGGTNNAAQPEAERLDHTSGVTGMNPHSKAEGPGVSGPRTMAAVKTTPSVLILDLCTVNSVIPFMVLSGIPGYQAVLSALIPFPYPCAIGLWKQLHRHIPNSALAPALPGIFYSYLY